MAEHEGIPRLDIKIRRLLQCAGRGIDLSRFPLAVELQRAMGASNMRDALMAAIDAAFDVSVERERTLRHAMVQCDVMRQKAADVAKELKISPDHLFHLRAEATTVLAKAINRRLLQNQVSGKSLAVNLACRLREFEPALAAKLFRVAEGELADRTAYDAVCNALSATARVDHMLLVRCTGYWEPLALVKIAHDHAIRGCLGVARRARKRAEASLNPGLGRNLKRAAFEVVSFDYADAVRRCDGKARREAIRRMALTEGNDLVSIGLGLASEAECALDELEVQDAAITRLRRLERFPTDGHGINLLVRIAHAVATIRFTLLKFENVAELSSSTAILAQNSEPGIAVQAHALAGRAALSTQRRWTFPRDIAESFRAGWAGALLWAVRARHLVSTDPEAALEMSKEAARICRIQGAPAAYAYALATEAIAMIALERGRGDKLLLKSWKAAVALSCRNGLIDQLVHPALMQRGFGPFALDDEFFEAVEDIVMRRSVQLGIRSMKWLGPIVRDAVASAISYENEIRFSAHGRREASLGARRVNKMNDASRAAFYNEMRVLAWILSSCLPFDRRALFEHNFLTALCTMIPALLAPASSSVIA